MRMTDSHRWAWRRRARQRASAARAAWRCAGSRAPCRCGRRPVRGPAEISGRAATRPGREWRSAASRAAGQRGRAAAGQATSQSVGDKQYSIKVTGRKGDRKRQRERPRGGAVLSEGCMHSHQSDKQQPQVTWYVPLAVILEKSTV